MSDPQSLPCYLTTSLGMGLSFKSTHSLKFSYENLQYKIACSKF